MDDSPFQSIIGTASTAQKNKFRSLRVLDVGAPNRHRGNSEVVSCLNTVILTSR